MAAFTANQVTINNGDIDVVINSGETTEQVQYGDFLVVGDFAPAQINRTYVNQNNLPVIELVIPWKNSNQSTQPAIVIPTTVKFKETVSALQNANRIVNDNTQAMNDWQTLLGEVKFLNIDGTETTVKTLKQIEEDTLNISSNLTNLVNSLQDLTPEQLTLVMQSAVNFQNVMDDTGQNFEDLFYSGQGFSQVTLNYGYFADTPGLIRISNGEIGEDDNWLYSGLYKINAGDSMIMNLYTAGSLAAIAFYNSNGDYVSGVASTFSDQEVIAPEGATQFRICRGNPANYSAAQGKTVKVEITKNLIDLPKIEQNVSQAVSLASSAVLDASKLKEQTDFFDLHVSNSYARKLDLSGDKMLVMYGDSISSTDYPWAAQRMGEITGGQVYAAGIPGATMGQLTTQPRMDRIFNSNPDVVVIFAGGNDTGRETTVGTFDGSVLGEPIVSEIDIAQDYDGTYNVQAMDYIVRKVKSFYYDIRARANLTGSETEEEKTAKIDALAMPHIVLCTPIPQKRYTDDHVYSQPQNWKRKRDCVIEVAKKNNVHCVDLYAKWGQSVDMTKEPFWETPTDVETNNGIYTMDGLHPNKWGGYLWAELLAADLGL